MADINVEYENPVPIEVYRARYSKEFARREMAIQKKVEANHQKQLKVWREQMIKEHVRPF